MWSDASVKHVLTIIARLVAHSSMSSTRSSPYTLSRNERTHGTAASCAYSWCSGSESPVVSARAAWSMSLMSTLRKFHVVFCGRIAKSTSGVSKCTELASLHRMVRYA